MAGPIPSTQPARRARAADPKPVTIAAIMPLYNGRSWVEQSLRSVLAQTVAPDEIIVVDDGSTDDGPELVRAIAAGNPKVQLITQPNGGQSAARNLAISRCSSDWIALIDQDDIWYPNHLEELADAARYHRGLRLGWVYSDFDDIDVDGRMVNRDYIDKTLFENPKRDLMKVLGQGFLIQPSATLISRAAILEAGGFDERLSGYEDDDLFLRIFRAGFDNVFVSEPTSQWRIHAMSAGGTARAEESLRVYTQKLLDTFPNDPWRGYYYRSDLIAPRMIRIWVHMYFRAGRYRDREKMRLYAREAGALVRYLRPRQRAKMRMAIFWLRQPLFIRARSRPSDEQSYATNLLSTFGRRVTGF